ncbi:hypothetical protein GQ44DRAFT_762759 [Phaeosphaeriaceae sp. PMI808]|nr:hypothetical protein GQ44DRAFT_762759 [Phaeosphaeriaceae sp. PMI808]
MRIIHVQHVLSFATHISAFILRDGIATGTVSQTETSRSKPHFEGTQNGFDSVTTTTSTLHTLGNIRPTETRPPDVISIIQSFLSALPAPFLSIRIEQSVDGWRQYSPRIEVTADGFLQPTPTEISPDGFQPTGDLVNSFSRVTPPPAIIRSGITLQPVPVTSVKVTAVDGSPATVAAVVNYRYVVGSATLQIGTPMTINNVVVVLTIDAAGSTVLVAGDERTTLPPPARGEQITQPVTVSTTIVDGTVKYILAGQTLAPGQGVTVGGIPISIGTRDGSTILVMGNLTTTFDGGLMKTTAFQPGASTAATSKLASTSTKAGAPSSGIMSQVLMSLLGLAAMIQQFI